MSDSSMPFSRSHAMAPARRRDVTNALNSATTMAMRMRLAALELRLALLKERARTLAHVVGRRHQPEQRRLVDLRVCQRHVGAAMHGVDDVARGDGRLRRQ